MTKFCRIIGYYPLIICGEGTTVRNYNVHSQDYVQYDSYGGGMTTTMFNLKVLYEQFQLHQNFWTRSNLDLDLVRYHSVKFTFFRHPEVDFLVQFNRNPPFTDSVLTGPMLHPGILMNTRKKIIIPSLLTRPRGRKKISVRIGPPRLFTDHWYFQRDFCAVPLLTVNATACNLRFPFGSPQTKNICIYFLVLANIYNDKLSIEKTAVKENYTKLLTAIESGPRKKTAFNTFKTIEHIREPDSETYRDKSKNNPPFKYTNTDSLWGDSVYLLTESKNIFTAFKENAENLWKARKDHTLLGSKELNFKTGMYSAIFLSNGRLSPDYPGIYTEVVYNPLLDKGEGNMLWLEWCTKPTSEYNEKQCYNLIQHVPLWAAIHGYIDFCKKTFKDNNLDKNTRVMIICPYTKPILYNRDKPKTGYVAYDYNFAQTKMPDGGGYIPEYYRFRWYPSAFHQQNWMNDLDQCGPFSYKGDLKLATLTSKYNFKFTWGGNPIFQQTVKDPCKQSTFDIPGASGLPRPIQIINPKYLDPGITFHRWDIRRGFFGPAAVKRMQAESTDALFPTTGTKRPRTEVPVAVAGDALPSRERKRQAWQESTSEETESEAEAQEEKTLQEQLQQQLKEQRQLRCGIQYMFQQLTKTQLHLHVPPIPQ